MVFLGCAVLGKDAEPLSTMHCDAAQPANHRAQGQITAKGLSQKGGAEVLALHSGSNLNK